MNRSISLPPLSDLDDADGDKAAPPFYRLLFCSLQAHAILFLVAIVYFMAVGWYYDLDAVDRALDVLLALVGLLATTLLLAAVHRFYVYVTDTRPHHPIAQLFRDLWWLVRNKGWMSLILPTAISMSVFIETYLKAKIEITAEANTYWDETFTRWDLVLHLGSLPWQWLQPVFGNPVLSFLVNLNYNCWFLVMWSVWMAYAFSERHRAIRTRFLLSFMLIWSLGGTVAATALASVGPCYYDEMGWSPNPYEPLLTYLNHADSVLPLWALDVQSALWQGSLGNAVPLGISAMPSMHNAAVLLLVLASAGFGKKVRWALGFHALFVFLGSVHLAWHYAVDAYVAWLLTILVWYGTGPLARWWDNRPVSIKFWGMFEASRRYVRP